MQHSCQDSFTDASSERMSASGILSVFLPCPAEINFDPSRRIQDDDGHVVIK